jgi:hypothetical protein
MTLIWIALSGQVFSIGSVGVVSEEILETIF